MIDPSLQPYLDHWAKAWADLPPGATPAMRRERLEQLSDAARKPLPPGVESTVAHVDGPARRVRVRLFRPASAEPLPCLVYMHGGGWMQGSPETHDEITAAIAHDARHIVVSVDYALAPELPFPAAVDDCAAVLRWVHASAEALGVDSSAVSVGGDSAGANLAAAMTLLFRGAAQAPRSQLLFYPPVDFAHDRPSIRENADGPIITARGLAEGPALYLPRPGDRTDPLAAPMLAASHEGLPPAFIAVAEHDPLRDEGRDYAERLRASGVDVVLHEGRGLFHGYLRAISWAPVAREPLTAACAWLSQRTGARASPR